MITGNQKIIYYLILLLTVVAAGCMPGIRADRDTLFQESTIGALMQGVYDGEMTVGELRSYGDFGIGTFDALDGEMLVIDGSVYKAALDGTIQAVPDSATTPFAAVTFFDADQVINLNRQMDLEQLQSYIDGLLDSENYFYAVRIDGKFGFVKTRSVPSQNKPYPPLSEAVKSQQVTEFRDVEGTVVGFRSPLYVEGVNVPGYHFHFIDKDRKKGGHVLGLLTSDVIISIDLTSNFVMELPVTQGFHQVRLGADAAAGLEQVEKGR